MSMVDDGKAGGKLSFGGLFDDTGHTCEVCRVVGPGSISEGVLSLYILSLYVALLGLSSINCMISSSDFVLRAAGGAALPLLVSACLDRASRLARFSVVDLGFCTASGAFSAGVFVAPPDAVGCGGSFVGLWAGAGFGVGGSGSSFLCRKYAMMITVMITATMINIITLFSYILVNIPLVFAGVASLDTAFVMLGASGSRYLGLTSIVSPIG